MADLLELAGIAVVPFKDLLKHPLNPRDIVKPSRVISSKGPS